MAQSDWIFNLEDEIVTVVRAKANKVLKTKYPDFTVTSSSNSSGTTSKFPCAYIHEIPGYEIGKDLEGKNVNGLYYVLQVDVYGNKTKADVKNVMSVILGILKEMSFDVLLSPNFVREYPTYQQTMTVRRNIGQTDKL